MSSSPAPVPSPTAVAKAAAAAAASQIYDDDEDEGLFQMFTPSMSFDSWFKDFLGVYSKDPLLDQVAGKQIIIDAIQDEDQKEQAKKLMRTFPGDSLRDFGAKLDMQFDGRSRQDWEALTKSLKQVSSEHTFAFAHRCKNLFEFLAIDDGGRDKIKSKDFQEKLLDAFLDGLKEERLRRKLYFKGVQTLDEALEKIRITRSNDKTILSITEKRRGETWARTSIPTS